MSAIAATRGNRSGVLKKAVIVFGILIIAALAYGVAGMKLSPLSWGWFGEYNTASGVALDGYDPIAYHKTGAPQQGDEANSVEWKGAKWLFASADNKAVFEANPEIYAPQFGANCAQGVSSGITALANPEVWHIDKGKLYVFLFDSAKTDFVAKIGQGILDIAEENWSIR